MEILTSVRRLYISFKSLVNDFVYSFGRAALLLLVEVWNHTVPVRERRRIRVKSGVATHHAIEEHCPQILTVFLEVFSPITDSNGGLLEMRVLIGVRKLQ